LILVFVWQEDSCHAAIPFGDEPNLFAPDMVNRHKALVVVNGIFIDLAVFLANVPPVAREMAKDEFLSEFRFVLELQKSDSALRCNNVFAFESEFVLFDVVGHSSGWLLVLVEFKYCADDPAKNGVDAADCVD
jgi:hypothetical protein